MKKNKKYKFKYFPSCQGFDHLVPGFQISAQGPFSSFVFVFSILLFTASRRRTLFSAASRTR